MPIAVIRAGFSLAFTDAARITKPDTEMFHYESWKPIHFVVKRSEVKVKN